MCAHQLLLELLDLSAELFCVRRPFHRLSLDQVVVQSLLDFFDRTSVQDESGLLVRFCRELQLLPVVFHIGDGLLDIELFLCIVGNHFELVFDFQPIKTTDHAPCLVN